MNGNSETDKDMSADVSDCVHDASRVQSVTASDYMGVVAHARPYNRAAYEQGWLNGLAQLDNGKPAWPVADANGIRLATFRQRLARGWSGERAATEPVRADRPVKPKPETVGDDLDDLESEAVANGISRRAFRARVKAGHPPHLAAMRRMV